MEKVHVGTADLTEENVRRLAELFPQVATEVTGEDGQLQRAIDFDALRQLLGDVAEGGRERYQFTWPGKQAARAEAFTPVHKTLRPCPEKSKDWETTGNLYIEGDNLDALKILRKTYAGKVKLIYIDPPYNTGKDFIYDDDFGMSRADYEAASGEFDEEGGRFSSASTITRLRTCASSATRCSARGSSWRTWRGNEIIRQGTIRKESLPRSRGC